MKSFINAHRHPLQMNFYIDTNIYLNLWKKEGDAAKGIPYWKLAKDFIDKAEKEGSIIVFTGLIIKELKYKLTQEQYREKEELLKASFERAEVADEDYRHARKLESKTKFEISFYDCLHMAVCIRLGLVLVTRDALLLNAAKKEGIKCGKPENFL